jgi:SAM-dependent methyltransferase
LLAENSYGWRKRFAFVAETIDEITPSHVLDIGCGTGAGLTLPLAKTYPGIEFLGIDKDMRTIRQARQNPHPPNLRFSDAEPALGHQFDLVIASEVLEHVEDPAAFVARLYGFVRAGGRLVITVPNGYGPFEWFALLEVLLNLSGVQRALRALKRPGRPVDGAAATLSISPHVNFFSRRALLRLFEGSGLGLRRFRPTTFVCGYLVDSAIRNPRVVAWNARVADRLPPCFASDWMFELEPREAAIALPAAPWRRNVYGRLRRHLNRRRWGLV